MATCCKIQYFALNLCHRYKISLLEIYSMNFKSVNYSHSGYLLLVILAFLLLPEFAQAQTCRVSEGFASDGSRAFKEVFEYDFVDEKPQFPGGNEALMAFINKTRQYPAEAYEKGIEGRVTCSFVVNSDGNISHLRVIKGSHKSLNLEAMRILAEMPNWVPGRHHDRCVPVRVIHSIPFRK